MKTVPNQIQSKSDSILWSFSKAMLLALLFSAAVFLICALLLTYTEFNENIISPISFVITIICSFFVGLKTSSKASKTGIIWGILSAAAYISIIIIIISLPRQGLFLNGFTILSIIASLISGAAGGVLGINTKK